MKNSEIRYHVIFLIFSIFMAFISLRYILIYNTSLIVEYRDVIYPPIKDVILENYIYTWSETGSVANFESIARIWFIIFQLISSDVEELSRILFVFFYSMNFFIPYLSFFYLFKEFLKIDIINNILISFILGLFYYLNPYVVMSYSPPYTYILSYSLMPTIIMATLYFLRTDNVKSKLFLAIIVTLVITPIIRYIIHISILMSITTFIYIVFYEKNILRIIKKYIFLSILILSFNLYWILLVIISMSSKTLVPSYSLNYDMTYLFSRSYTIPDIITIKAAWWPYLELRPIFSEYIWAASLFIVPLLVFLSILFWRHYSKEEKTLYVIGTLIYITGIFIWNGLNEPTNKIYDLLLFSTPSFIGWMFRLSGYFGTLVILGYALCIGVFLVNLFKKKNIKYVKIGISTLIIISLFFIGWQKFSGDLDGILKKGYYFDDVEYYGNISYNKSVTLLSNYTGNSQHHHSGKPFINLNNDLKTYLINNLKKNDEKSIAYILSNIGVGVLITNLEIKTPMYFSLSGSKEGINIYTLKKERYGIYSDSNIFYIPKPNHDYLSKFSQITTDFAFTSDKNISKNIVDPSKLDIILDNMNYQSIEPFKSTNRFYPSRVWSKAATNDPLHGDWHTYIEKYDIDNWENDYGKGIIFTWSNSIIEDNVNPTDKELQYVYDFKDIYANWEINGKNIQSIKLDLNSGKHSIQLILNESRWGWETISSPMISVNSPGYRWIFYVKGENASGVHVKIAEFDSKKDLIDAKLIKIIGTGTFDWEDVSFNYVPENKDVAYIQLQIWHGHETMQPLPNKIWIGDVKVYNLSKYFKPVTVDMNIKINKDDEYELFVRYFKNKEGGRINISLDGKIIKYINTKDQLNKFIWEKVPTLNLKKGKYKLSLTNDEGFNAVNVFALIHKKEYQEMEKNVTSLIEGKRLIHILEAESDLYRDNVSISEKYGGKASNGEVLEFNETSVAWQIVDILRSDNYKMALKINGSFDVKVDDIIYNISSNISDFVYIGPMYLNKGNHKIGIQGNNSDLDVIWLYSVNNLSKKIESKKTANTTIPIIKPTGREIAIKTDKRRGFIPINQPPGNIIEINEGDNIIWFNEEVIPVIFISDIPEFGERFLDYGRRTSYMFTRQGPYHFRFRENKNFNVTIIVKSSNKTIGNDTSINSSIEDSEKLEDIFSVKEIPASITSYNKINPTLYNTKINAKKPFILSFAESYDPLWIVKVVKINGKIINSEIIRPIPLYSIVNGFWINQTGDLDITIEYEPQRWFYIGATISIITLIICIGYLIYDSRRKKNK